jgi:GTP-binding protein LepA
MQAQVLDDMDLEKERGITIKSHAIQMDYAYNGEKYILNLIDTPGHVDFSYEVSRSIAACEGALLIVDAAQGIQAQTISNLYLALEHNLKIIPILNKIDLPSAEPEMVKDQIVDLLGCDREEIMSASGKTGMGVHEILEEVVNRIPAPSGDPNAPLQALVFDSVFNSFRGIIAYFRIYNGSIKKGEKVKFFNTGMEYNADEIGVLRLKPEPRDVVKTGDVGYIISGIKEAKEVKVGDTLTTVANPCPEGIHGFEEVKPMVFAGIYPVDTEDFEELRYSMEKLQLNDASLTWEAESSLALGFGFRCGFLGMLHMEIVQERLEREFNMTVITTVPNVSYIAYQTNGDVVTVNNPSDLPDPARIDYIEEPYIKANIITKADFIGPVMSLCIEKRGLIVTQNYLTADRVELVFEMPLGEVVFDFFDRLKSISKGYASFDYHPIGMRESDLVKLDILLKSEPVDALSCLIHRSNSYHFGKKICEKLKELIPKQQFEIPIQAAIGAKIISRETISAMRKDVTAKCYGGDISRKRKLLEKQKEGKKRMKSVGNVEIPQSAFMAVLKLND